MGAATTKTSTATSPCVASTAPADIIIKGADDLSHKDTGRRNEDYFVYGKQILAAAPGTVVTAIDGVPDNKPGSMNPLCTVGNCLIIEQGSNEYRLREVSTQAPCASTAATRSARARSSPSAATAAIPASPTSIFICRTTSCFTTVPAAAPFRHVKCGRDDATLTDANYTFLQGDHIQSATKK